MKKIINIAVFILFSVTGQAQKSISGTQYASKVAQRMADSLKLTSAQENKVYNINLGLHTQEMDTRKKYTSRDSLAVHFQKIENSRDAMYRAVLTNNQYELYMSKKIELLNNN